VRSIAAAAFATLTWLGTLADSARADDMAASLDMLGHDWAKVYYGLAEARQEAAYPPLVAEVEGIAAAHPDRAEPLIWEAIILSCYAKAKGGLGALRIAERARDTALAAAKLDDRALDAGAYTALGALYYKVPGWPVGFGNDTLARQYLDKALAIAPSAVDVNYFYGDFMIEQGDKKQARGFLEKALQGPSHAGREDAEAGRRREIQDDLAKLGQ
jgi:tetratricopeptide (TPR) repeat protein